MRLFWGLFGPFKGFDFSEVQRECVRMFLADQIYFGIRNGCFEVAALDRMDLTEISDQAIFFQACRLFDVHE